MSRTIFPNRRSPGAIVLLFTCTLLLLLVGSMYWLGQRTVAAREQDRSPQDTCTRCCCLSHDGAFNQDNGLPAADTILPSADAHANGYAQPLGCTGGSH